MAGKTPARFAAERHIEAALRNAEHTYGGDVEAHATAIVADFTRVWWEYDGPRRRVMIALDWEVDPDA
jgi:hypothetical protein